MRGALEQAPVELERVLTHELTHARIVNCAARRADVRNEGIAVMFEPEGSNWATRTLFASDRRIPLDRLAASFDNLSN